MRVTFVRRFWASPLRRDEQGIVLAVVLIVMVLLLGMGLTSLFSGYTNLLISTNLKIATQARNTAEAGVNEAIYRLSRQDEPGAGAIVPNLSGSNWANWQVQIMPYGTASSPTQVATIQHAGDWLHAADTPPVTLQYKKDANGNVIFYDRTQNPVFFTIPPSNLDPISAFPNAHPVIQILATGIDDRDAERQLIAEVTSTVAFAPPAPLSSGVSVNLNGTSFIDGVNHDRRIVLNPGSAHDDKYGDDSDETTTSNNLQDSPDDSAIDPDSGPGTPCGPGPAGSHDRANPYLTNPLGMTNYTSCARLYNKQISSAASAPPAWVGDLQWVGSDTHSSQSHWHYTNNGFAAAIALSSGPTVVGGQLPTSIPWNRGVFTWRNNNILTNLTGTVPAVGTTTSCSPAGVDPPPLTCRPPSIATFPTFQQFLGLDDVSFQNLLDKPDTCGGTQATCSNVLSATTPPREFTYVQMNSLGDEYVWDSTYASPNTDEFGLFYVYGSLRINGHQTFKGLIFVEGSLTIVGNPTVLGAIMVRGATNVTAGTGNLTLLYSRKAAELGIQAGHPWRILTWEDTAIQGSTYAQ